MSQEMKSCNCLDLTENLTRIQIIMQKLWYHIKKEEAGTPGWGGTATRKCHLILLNYCTTLLHKGIILCHLLCNNLGMTSLPWTTQQHHVHPCFFPFLAQKKDTKWFCTNCFGVIQFTSVSAALHLTLLFSFPFIIILSLPSWMGLECDMMGIRLWADTAFFHDQEFIATLLLALLGSQNVLPDINPFANEASSALFMDIEITGGIMPELPPSGTAGNHLTKKNQVFSSQGKELSSNRWTFSNLFNPLDFMCIRIPLTWFVKPWQTSAYIGKHLLCMWLLFSRSDPCLFSHMS